MVFILFFLLLIIIIFFAIFLGIVLAINPEQRRINDKEQLQWINELKAQKAQERKK